MANKFLSTKKPQGGKQVAQTRQPRVAQKQADAEHYVISRYLQELKFSPRVMGVDEADVWKKIEKLCELYDEALTQEREKNKKLTAQLNACALQLKRFLKQEDQPNG